MASKQVSEILIKLGIDGLQGLDRLKSSFRELEKSIGPSDATIQRARKSILDFGDAGIRSEQIIRGQLEAFRGLKSQAEINGSTFTKLTEDIKKLELELSGSTAAINRQREAILRSTASSNDNITALKKQAEALGKLQQQTRPGSAAFIQLGKDVEKVEQKLTKARSEAQEFAFTLNQFPAVSLDKQVRQIGTLTRKMNTLKITSDEYLQVLQRISLISAVQATTTGRQQVRAAAQMYESPLYETFVRTRAEEVPLPATTAGMRQRISEINQELANVTGYERRRALTVELIDLNRQLKKAVIDITTTEELAAMATRQRASAAREVLGRSGFGAFSAEIRARAAGGAYDPGTQKAMERARNRIVDQEAVQEIEELYGRWEQAYSEIEGLFERHQVTKAEIAAKGARAQNEILDRQHDQSLREQQRRFEEELALFDQNLNKHDQLLQRRGAIKGMLGLSGRELSPLYQGIVDIGTRRAAAEQARMGRTPQQALADIVNVFNSDLDRAGNGFLESERQLREAAIEFAGGSRKVREKFEQIALGKTPAGMFPAPGEDPAAYTQRIEAPAAGLREIIENFRKKTDRTGDGFLEAEKKLRQAAIDFAGNSEEVKRAFARVPLGKTPTSMLPGAGEVPSEYISRIRGGFEDVRLPDFASFRKGTTRELQLVRQSLQELRLDLSPLAAGFETTEKRIVRSIRNIDKELERRQIGGRRMTGMQVAQAAGAAVSGGIFGGPEGFLGGALGGVFGGVGGAFAGAAAGAQIGALRQQLGGFADYAAQIQKMQIALEGAAGSQAEFNQAVAAAASATQNLNVPQDVAIQGMTRLTAAVKGAGGQVTDAELVFKNVTAAIKGTGGSAEDVDGAITAMVQVFSKGKVSAEELSGQLGERLPGAVTKFAKANDMTLPELQKALEQGQVGLNELMNFIVQLGDEYAGVAEKIAGSSQDAGARLTVAYNNMRIAVGEALQPIGAAFQEAFIPFIENITPVLVDVLPKIGEFALALAKNFDTLAIAAAAALGVFAVGKIAAIGGIGAALLQLAAAAGTASVSLKALNAAALLNPWTALAAGVAAVAVAFYDANKEKERFDAVISSGTTDELAAEFERLQQKIIEASSKTASYSSDIRGIGNDAGYASIEIRNMRNELERIKGEYRVRLLFEQAGLDPEKGFYTPVGKTKPKPSEFPRLTDTKKGAGKAKKERESQLPQLLAELAVRQQIAGIEEKIRNAQLAENQFLQIRLEGERELAEIAGRINAIVFEKIPADEAEVKRKILLLEADKARANISQRLLQADKEGIKEITQESNNLADSYTSQIEERKRFFELVAGGTKDALALEFIQIEKIVEKERERLEIQKALLQAVVEAGGPGAGEARTGIANIDELLGGLGEREAGLKVLAGEAQIGKLQAFIDQAEAELRDLESVAVRISQGIGDAIGSSIANGITGLIEGTTNVKQIFANFLKDIAQILIQEGAKIIATYIAIGIAKQFAGLLPGGSQAGKNFELPNQAFIPSGGFKFPGAANGAYFAGGQANFAQNSVQPFASGGIVTKPTFFKYADGGAGRFGLMGEAGPEAIMPLKRGPDGKLGVAVADNRSFLNAINAGGGDLADNEDQNGSVLTSATRASIRETERIRENRMQIMNQQSASERRYERERIEQMASTPGKLDIKYESQVINNVEYVTRDQAERMAAQSAIRGRELALSSLQNSVKTRKRVGMA